MKEKKKMAINNALLNLISPIGFLNYKTKMDIGENTTKGYGVIRYNESYDYGWMEPLMNIPGTIASVSYQPLPEGDAMDIINNNMQNLKRKLNEATDPLRQKQLEADYDNSDKMLDDLCRNEASVGLVSTTLMAVTNEDYIDKVDSRIKGECKKGKLRHRLMAGLQKELYQHMSPCYPANKNIKEIVDRPAPLRSILGGFPFASSGFNDGSGYVFGSLSNSSNIANSNMILDIWKRGQDRNNSNIVIMGEPGSGKSTKVKDIMTSEFMMGTKLIVIDPEREYKTWGKNVGANWINAGGGSGKINPLQVRALPTDPDEDGDKNEGLPDLAAYLMHLKAWFKMAYPDLTDAQINALEKILISVYKKFNISWDTDFDKLKPTDYPIMADVLSETEVQIANIYEDEDEYLKKDLCAIRDVLDNMVTGSCQFLWNGHSTIDMDSDVVILDTHDLQDTPDNIKAAQYYNILTWAWVEASKDRSQKVMIVADEAYLMIDRRIPQALIFLRNGFKRGRKYEISFALVSHSVVDFLHESIRLYGEAILDNSSIKILMGCDGQNLKETVALYKLTEAEEDTLALKQRGLAIMIIGAIHLKVKFEVADYRWSYFGSAGGR